MNKLTYQEAYNKIIDAYFKDEIEPMDPEFCFCGTLSPDRFWYICGNQKYNYSKIEYTLMEEALFSGFPEVEYVGITDIEIDGQIHNVENYEDKLFNGMCASLEVLK